VSTSREYHGFDIARVARYSARDEARLLADPGIIRNRLKVKAAIENAKRIEALQSSHGSFATWLDAHHPLDRGDWQRLFKQTFVFTGGEIVHEFLLSTGYLAGAHVETCPVYGKVLRARPPWSRR
jgi:DNA-3-methyladenine glycosylase I